MPFNVFTSRRRGPGRSLFQPSRSDWNHRNLKFKKKLQVSGCRSNMCTFVQQDGRQRYIYVRHTSFLNEGFQRNWKIGSRSNFPMILNPSEVKGLLFKGVMLYAVENWSFWRRCRSFIFSYHTFRLFKLRQFKINLCIFYELLKLHILVIYMYSIVKYYCSSLD